MNKTTADTSHADDWLTPLLLRDAHGDPNPPQDAAFVAQVLARLDVPPASSMTAPVSASTRRTPPIHAQGLLLGFQFLVAVFMCMAAPATLDAWLQLAQAPLDTSAWQDPHVWGFMLGVGMLACGVHELMNTSQQKACPLRLTCL